MAVFSDLKKKDKIKKLDDLHLISFKKTPCYTCGRRDLAIERGHFISRRHIRIRWHVNNIRPQCVHCNRNLSGNLVLFEKYLTQEIGQDAIDELIYLKGKQVTHDFLNSEYERLKCLLKQD
jgi:hypothetical protein